MDARPPANSVKALKPSRSVALAAMAFLCFTLGTVIYEFRLFPFSYMNESYAIARAYYSKYLLSQETFPHFIWQKAKYPGNGVTHYDPVHAYSGYTVYSSAHKQSAVIMNMDGGILHEWSLTFRDVWPRPDHIQMPVHTHQIYYRRVYPYQNGDLLAVFVAAGDTPWGYGLAKMDKNSKLIWRYSENTHHDIDVAEDGKIYALVHHINTNPSDSVPIINSSFLDDSVAILSSDGEEIKRINILQAFLNSDFHWAKQFIVNATDPLHTNTVKVVSRETADIFSFLQTGNIVISIRNMDIVAVIDPALEKVVWATRGPWHLQHDPDFLKNGNLLIFDNLGHAGPGVRSRVLEIDPLTQRIVWSYEGGENEFFSFWRSCQQRLPNGNTLITESDPGRMIEVTKDKEVVWEYINPHRGGESQELVPSLTGGMRVPTDYFTFINDSGTRKDEV